jgi:hypothetical protein
MNIRYLVSRGVIVAVFGVALGFAGLRWWWAALAAAVTLGFFLVAPHSGRYVVRTQGGVAPLRRDERARAIRDKATRNGFVLTVLGVGGPDPRLRSDSRRTGARRRARWHPRPRLCDLRCVRPLAAALVVIVSVEGADLTSHHAKSAGIAGC